MAGVTGLQARPGVAGCLRASTFVPSSGRSHFASAIPQQQHRARGSDAPSTSPRCQAAPQEDSRARSRSSYSKRDRTPPSRRPATDAPPSGRDKLSFLSSSSAAGKRGEANRAQAAITASQLLISSFPAPVRIEDEMAKGKGKGTDEARTALERQLLEERWAQAAAASPDGLVTSTFVAPTPRRKPRKSTKAQADAAKPVGGKARLRRRVSSGDGEGGGADRIRAAALRKATAGDEVKLSVNMKHLSKKRAISHRRRKGGVSRTEKDSVSLFLHDIGNTDLLTKQQEVELSLRAQDALLIERIEDELREKLGRAATDEEVAKKLEVGLEDMLQMRSVGQEAKVLMVEHNLRLVVSIAKRYTGRGVSLGDLIQEGTLGLMRGVEKFDPERGFKFSTYAHWWIRQAVTRAVSDNSRTIRLPVHIYDTLSRIKKAVRALDGGDATRSPSAEEIGEYMNLPSHKVVSILEAAQNMVSLDAGEYQRSDASPGEEVPLLVDQLEAVNPDREPEGQTETKFLQEDVNAVLATLLPRERNILRMRYGLATADGKCMTLVDIGAAYGVTRERIRQIEEKALRKLRQPRCAVPLKDYLEETAE